MIIKNELARIGLLLFTILLFSCNDNKSSGVPTANEKYRPQFHFTPQANWMNDPNGMVYYEGEYHLFYQYYPDSTVWGPMHWGHAVSKDLIHWEHLPIALYPDSLGYIYSGSAVIDWENTTGFGSKENPPMVAIYTYHNMEAERAGANNFETQALAYSLDKGRTWKKYKNNPVLPNPELKHFRDPKVIWHEESEQWIMILAAGDRVKFYASKDLKLWSFKSDFMRDTVAQGGGWECPDLFPLKLEGSDITKWIILVSINPGGPNGGSATQYFVGDFDGSSFQPDVDTAKWLDWGMDNYAGVTWSDIPEEDGRRLFIGWMSNWQYAQEVPTESWRSAMTLPRELKLVQEKDDIIIVSNPIKEFNVLKEQHQMDYETLLSGEVPIDIKELDLNSCELNFVFEPQEASQNGHTTAFGLLLRNDEEEELKLGYNMLSKKFFMDRTNVCKAFSNPQYLSLITGDYTIQKQVKMKIIIDASSIEVFVDDGKFVMTNTIFPQDPFNQLSLFSSLGSVKIREAEFFNIKNNKTK
ncbi:glycoside hydrolase family 32 protein [Carboxylicivirga linearis]|uniref:Glycoside hydrolase family 32 protein n=1 Tax=Carboxylicivirga linearis TaxID=1628157 RepID=A0ABS5K0S7_9BACT|nr:glycoside hydrolase family 32 protein [Carboxylicivirga linearis]MBS2100291.1 glycoside hydrolase family 32 protein [Carboxylicivirga linearis]